MLDQMLQGVNPKTEKNDGTEHKDNKNAASPVSHENSKLTEVVEQSYLSSPNAMINLACCQVTNSSHERGCRNNTNNAYLTAT